MWTRRAVVAVLESANTEMGPSSQIRRKSSQVLRKSLLAIFVLAAAVLPARATTFARLSLDEMTRLATRIVEARAIESHSAWNAEHTTIFTYTTFVVLDSLKGASASEKITVKQFGGKVGHILMKVYGEPQFPPGEDAILFLYPDPQEPDTERIVGMAQGNFRVVVDRILGEKFAVSAMEGASFYDPRTGTFSVPAGRQPLQEFKQKVRKMVGAEDKTPEAAPEPRLEK